MDEQTDETSPQEETQPMPEVEVPGEGLDRVGDPEPDEERVDQSERAKK